MLTILLQNFLLFQSIDVTRWSAAIADSRSAYTSLREHFLRYIENPDELGSALDPLDDDQHVCCSYIDETKVGSAFPQY